MRNMNNDFAKSILDNPYNRVEDGQKIELMFWKSTIISVRIFS